MENNNEKFDLLKWLKDLREKPLKTLGALLILILVLAISGVGEGIGEWFAAQASDGLSWACRSVHVCEGSLEQPGTLVFSTHVPNCLIGRIDHKFAQWTPAPSWEGNADRLVVCTDASEPVTNADMPEKLQKLVPDCLSVKRDGDKITIATAIGNPAICRARYRFDGSKLVNTNLERGWFVCTPGYAHKPSSEVFTFAGKIIPACDDSVLHSYGFL